MRVLVTTVCVPDDRSSLCAVRSLARAGFETAIASDRMAGQACASRYVKGRFHLPHPSDSLDAYAVALSELLEAEPFDVVFPTIDYTTLAICANRARLSRLTSFALPDLATLQMTRNKELTLQAARRAGLDVPRTWIPEDAEKLQECLSQISFPCIIKPREGAAAFGFQVLRSVGELTDAHERLTDLARVDPVFDFERPLIQDYVPGEVHDVCALFCRGEPRAGLTQRRILCYPATGGAGIYNETTWDPDLREAAFALLRELKWHGPAQVEFRIDSRDGKARLMEVNGRPWGTMDLAVQAGIDFPYLTAQLAATGDIEPTFQYRVGLRYRWPFPFGALHCLQSRSLLHSFATFCLPRRGVRSDLRWNDPMPAIAEAAFSVRRMWRRRSLRPIKDRSRL